MNNIFRENSYSLSILHNLKMEKKVFQPLIRIAKISVLNASRAGIKASAGIQLAHVII